MATKGYQQYRGRGRGGKKLLVLLLLLILLGACAFLFLQRYIVYDSDGGIHLELPFGDRAEDGQPDKIPEEDVNIQREDPPQPEPQPEPEPEPLTLTQLHAKELPFSCLNSDPTSRLKDQEAVVVNIKRSDGTITYHTGIDLPANVLCGNQSTVANLQAITQSDCYTVARIAALCDYAYADAVPESAYNYTWGGVWQDNYGRYWLDPTQEKTAEYLCALAKECAQLGFDEILLDHMRFPIEGKLNQTTLSADINRAQAITHLVEKVREAVGPQVAVSIILPASIGTDYSFKVSGLTAKVLTEQFDRIYVPRDSSAYYWLDGKLTGDFDRATRLVLTGSGTSSGSYMIAQ